MSSVCIKSHGEHDKKRKWHHIPPVHNAKQTRGVEILPEYILFVCLFVFGSSAPPLSRFPKYFEVRSRGTLDLVFRAPLSHLPFLQLHLIFNTQHVNLSQRCACLAHDIVDSSDYP